MDKNKKNILITGGSSGIGRQAVELFAKRGHNVGFTYLDSKDLSEGFATALETSLGVSVKAYQMDAGVPAQVDAVFSKFINDFSKIDWLVNNAGWTRYMDKQEQIDISREQVDLLLECHLHTPLSLSLRALKEFKKQPDRDPTCRGIINVTSLAGKTGVGSNFVYAMAKASVNTMSLSLTRLGQGVNRTVAIAPGLVDTRMTQNLAPKEYVESAREKSPVGRMPSAIDIAKVIVSTALDHNFVNGTVIEVDGGTQRL